MRPEGAAARWALVRLEPTWRCIGVAALLASLLLGCGGKDQSGGTPSTDRAPTGRATTDSPRSRDQEPRKVDPSTVGSIEGTVRVDGAPPAAATLEMKADAWCKNHHDTPPEEESLVVGADGALANAFVWIKAGLEGFAFEAPTEPLELDQVGCIYRPRVTGVQLGQKVTMLNSDLVLHNVHTKPELNKTRNVALPSKGSHRDFSFAEPEVMIPVVCDVHPWMRAFIGVVAHPFFAVTESDGAFRLQGVPPGRYTVEVWHETLGRHERTVEVGESQAVRMDPVVITIP